MGNGRLWETAYHMYQCSATKKIIKAKSVVLEQCLEAHKYAVILQQSNYCQDYLGHLRLAILFGLTLHLFLASHHLPEPSAKFHHVAVFFQQDWLE